MSAFSELFDSVSGDPFRVLSEHLLRKAPPRHAAVKCVALHANSYGVGGLERVVREQCLLFRRMGLDVHLILNVPPDGSAYPVPEGVSVHVLPTVAGDFRSCVLHRAETLCAILAAADAGLYLDSAYQNLFFARSLELWDWAAVKTSIGIPVVLHWHSVFSRFIRMPGGERFAAALRDMPSVCDGVIALSRVDAAFFASMGLRSWFLPNPVDPDLAAAALQHGGGGRTVLWCGRIADVKRPLDALRVFSAARALAPGIRLVVVGGGDGQTLERMASFVRAGGLESCVEMAGERLDPYAFYRDADVLLSTSECEGYPMTFVEAMAFGVPVVSLGKGYLELARDNPAVVAVGEGDFDGAARAVADLMPGGRLSAPARRAAGETWRGLQAFDFAEAYGRVFAEASDGAPVRDGESCAELVSAEVVSAFAAGEAERARRLRRFLLDSGMLRIVSVARRLERIMAALSLGAAGRRHAARADRLRRLARFVKGGEANFT